MAIRLKKNGWIVLCTLIVAVATVVMFSIRSGSKENVATTVKSESKSMFSSIFGKTTRDYIVLGLDTYSPWAGIVHLNGGLEPNENSLLYKLFGIKLKIMIVETNREPFLTGEVDVTFVTGDTRPIEMSEGSNMLDTRFIGIVNVSEGADALVVNKTINTVADLAGKRGAFPVGQAGHTLLIEVLESSGMLSGDVSRVEDFLDDGKSIKVESGIEAAQAMKANQADFALVYAPDDRDILKNVPGSKILFTTKQAPNIILDGFIVKESYLEKNFEKVAKLMEAMFYSNVEMATNDEFLKGAAKTFARAFGVNEDFVVEINANGRIGYSVRDIVRFSTLGDNVNLFGFNYDYKGLTAEAIYNRMSVKYQQIGLARRPLPYGRTINTSIIESLIQSNSLTNDQSARRERTYVTPTTEVIAQATAVSNKKVVIEFNTGSYILDSNAQYIIDTEFAPIAKSFTNYIRVEGNTDNTGPADVNRELSRRRAQAAIDYLVKEHGISRDRFLPAVGNGSTKAIAAGSIGADRNYRSTDFQLIAE